MKKILIIQLAKMGDIIQSSYIIDAINQRWINPEIYILHSEIFSEVAQEIKKWNLIPINIDKISVNKNGKFILSESLYLQEKITEFSKNNFDVIINLNSTFIAQQVLQRISSNEKIGFGSNDNESVEWLSFVMSFIKNRKFSSINLVDIFRLIVLRKPFFIDSELNPIVSYHIPQKSNIIFQLSSRNIKRQIGIKYFVNLADNLVEKGFSIILVGVKSEEKYAEEFINSIKQKTKSSIQNLIAKTSIHQLSNIIKKSSLMITGDTGTMHLGSFWEIPIIAIFQGPAYPFETLSFSEKSLVCFPSIEEYKCYPCNEIDYCNFNLKCHTKQITDKIINVIENKNLSEFWSTTYDSLGQILIPNKKMELNYEMYFAIQYRIFAMEFFLNEKTTIEHYFNNFIIDEAKILLWKSHLHRELKLYKILTNRVVSFNDLIENFEILKPFLYLEMLMKNKNSKIKISLLNFLQEI